MKTIIMDSRDAALTTLRNKFITDNEPVDVIQSSINSLQQLMQKFSFGGVAAIRVDMDAECHSYWTSDETQVHIKLDTTPHVREEQLNAGRSTLFQPAFNRAARRGVHDTDSDKTVCLRLENEQHFVVNALLQVMNKNIDIAIKYTNGILETRPEKIKLKDWRKFKNAVAVLTPHYAVTGRSWNFPERYTREIPNHIRRYAYVKGKFDTQQDNDSLNAEIIADINKELAENEYPATTQNENPASIKYRMRINAKPFYFGISELVTVSHVRETQYIFCEE